MDLSRALAGIGAALIACALLAVPAGLVPGATSALRESIPPTRAAAELPVDGADRSWTPGDGGYPRHVTLHVYPDDPRDSAAQIGLVSYAKIASRLNALQAVSDRVSAEVVGRSVQGRDLYLVTVTAPETAAETARQGRWRTQIEDDPDAAERDTALTRGYKAPIWINANIHGDEPEGTDGALRVIERLATAADKTTAALLRRTRLYLTVTGNPDGRVAGTRENADGTDLNRDHVTDTEPETRAVRDVVIGTQPVTMLDEHGYLGETMVEPVRAPDGSDHAMLAAVEKLGLAARIDEPVRDGILAPMYADLQGSSGHIVNLPNPDDPDLPAAERCSRAQVNVDVAAATIEAFIGYADRHRTALIEAQIARFREGWAGLPAMDGIPRAYLIPAQETRLVAHLIAHDIRMTREGGHFLLDMHQPKRGLASALIETGRTPDGRVWGAEVISSDP
ncbi:M14 family zinc carboxypeptidase [Actinoplanes sp. NPDC051851]|uniref:M14 family zinc carboxypeptidase n=1 Tax=Actinoplanes sp. NPDC051851 TaxID=3154753 RepID=UPI0034375F6F